MKSRIGGVMIFGMAILLVAISGCMPLATPVPATTAPRGTPAIQAKPAWQEEWDRILPLARREGKVSIMATAPIARGVVQPFMEKYGVDLEFFVATAAELLAKVAAERSAGIYVRDIITGGFTPTFGILAPNLEPMGPALILPEVQDASTWRGQRVPFYDKEGKLFLFLARVHPTMVVNTETVKPEELKSWRSLLEPKWKGKILIFDPSIPGAGASILVIAREIMGADFLPELAKQEPVMNRDKRLQLEWVARGKYLIGIALDFTILEEMREAGVPLAHVVPSEGSAFGSGIGGMGMFSRPAHPNATKVFLNWFFSREGQTLFVKAAKEQSRRLDVAPAVPPDRLLREELKYIDYDTEDFARQITQMFTLSKEIFAAQYK